MFFKREMRPQTVGAPAPDSAWNKKLSSVMFNTATDAPSDFGGFGDEPERPSAPSGGNRGGNRSGFSGIKLDRKVVIIASAIAVVVLALLIVLGVALLSGDGNIRYENNAYMSYVDSQGGYHILSNGEHIDHVFEGDVDLIPAADNSFAYVFDHGGDGVYMYILEGKKLVPVLDTPVDSYLATATLEPGIVFTESASSGLNYMLYNEKLGIEMIVKESKDPDHFVISGDGETVVYTIADDDSDDRILYMYQDRIPEHVTDTSCVPVAVSNYGDYIYVQINTKGVRKLGIRDVKKEKNFTVDGSDNFLGILEMNIKGDEIIFCTGNGPDDLADIFDGDIDGVSSHLYRHKASEDNSTVSLGDNFVKSVKVDPEIAIYKNFADKYFETTVYDDPTADKHTYHLTSKYEKETLCAYSGKFDTNGDYFYYLNKDKELIQMDLNSKTRETVPAYNGTVLDFAVTEKGNIYLLDDDNNLVFRKTSTGRPDRPSSFATAMSFYTGSNKVYFSELESEVIYLSEEGSDKDIAKFGSTELTGVPYFSKGTGKKCFAVLYDETKETYSVFYTSNGNRFNYIKEASDCDEIIYGVEIPAALEW